MTEAPIEFKLDQPDNEGTFTYRPHGTRTLKLKLTSAADQEALRLRPGRLLDKDTAEGTFRGVAQGSENLTFNWGGGHEAGPPVRPQDFLMAFEKPGRFPAGTESYIYFNLVHSGDDAPEEDHLVIEAYRPKGLGRAEEVVSQLTVKLVRLADPPGGVIRMVDNTGAYKEWTPSAGAHLPAYDPRWWPAGAGYLPAEPVPLAVRRLGNELHVFWDGTDKAAAIIEDLTEPSILQPEHMQAGINTVAFDLFAWDEEHVALRVWFVWLNKNIGHQLPILVGRHEVPDAERVEVVIRRKDGRVILACTDLHWRETWGELPGPAEQTDVIEGGILRASIGMNREDVVKELKHKLDEKRAGAQAKVERLLLTPWRRLRGQSVEAPEDESLRNPIQDMRGVARERFKAEAQGADREKGTEAHVPVLRGVEQRRDVFGDNIMVSSDVRLVLPEF